MSNINNKNKDFPITIKVSCEDAEYFSMYVTKKELKTIEKFIEEINSSSQVSITIIEQ